MRDMEHIIKAAGNETGALQYTPVFGICNNIENDLVKVLHFINGGVA